MTIKLLIPSILLSTYLFSSANILSNTQNNILDLNNKKSTSDVAKLSKDWIDKGAITYTYSYNKTNHNTLPSTRISTLRISQSIFRSGGIYYAIKYASNVNDDSKLSLKIQKQNLIIQTLSTAYNIKKLDLQIQKQTLALKNAQIDYTNKKESVFNGLLDISFLNNAMLILNKTKISLIDLKFAKQNTINTLTTLSDLSYDKIPLPSLKLISKDEYNSKNLNIQKANIDIQKQTSLSGISNAQYLPKVVANASKTFNHTNHTDSYKYGFNIVVPIDFKTLNALQSNKLAILQEKANQNLLKQQEDIFFASNTFEIQNINEKISLTKQNIKAYKQLLSQTKEQYNAGLKTANDVEVLNNSKQSEVLSVKMYEIDKQIKLLELYKRVVNDKI